MASPTKHGGEDSVEDDNGLVRGNKRSILDTSLDKMIVDGQSLSEEKKDFIKKTRRFATTTKIGVVERQDADTEHSGDSMVVEEPVVEEPEGEGDNITDIGGEEAVRRGNAERDDDREDGRSLQDSIHEKGFIDDNHTKKNVKKM